MNPSVILADQVRQKLVGISLCSKHIKSTASFLLTQAEYAELISDIWLETFKSASEPSFQLALLYVANEIVTKSSKYGVAEFSDVLKPTIVQSVQNLRPGQNMPKITKLFTYWTHRKILDVNLVQDVLHKLTPDNPTKRVCSPSLATADDDAKAFNPEKLLDGLRRLKHLEEACAAQSKPDVSFMQFGNQIPSIISSLKTKDETRNLTLQVQSTCKQLDTVHEKYKQRLEQMIILQNALDAAELYYNVQSKELAVVVNAYGTYGKRVFKTLDQVNEFTGTGKPPDVENCNHQSNRDETLDIDKRLDEFNHTPHTDHNDVNLENCDTENLMVAAAADDDDDNNNNNDDDDDVDEDDHIRNCIDNDIQTYGFPSQKRLSMSSSVINETLTTNQPSTLMNKNRTTSTCYQSAVKTFPDFPTGVLEPARDESGDVDYRVLMKPPNNQCTYRPNSLNDSNESVYPHRELNEHSMDLSAKRNGRDFQVKSDQKLPTTTQESLASTSSASHHHSGGIIDDEDNMEVSDGEEPESGTLLPCKQIVADEFLKFGATDQDWRVYSQTDKICTIDVQSTESNQSTTHPQCQTQHQQSLTVKYPAVTLAKCTSPVVRIPPPPPAPSLSSFTSNPINLQQSTPLIRVNDLFSDASLFTTTGCPKLSYFPAPLLDVTNTNLSIPLNISTSTITNATTTTITNTTCSSSSGFMVTSSSLSTHLSVAAPVSMPFEQPTSISTNLLAKLSNTVRNKLQSDSDSNSSINCTPTYTTGIEMQSITQSNLSSTASTKSDQMCFSQQDENPFAIISRLTGLSNLVKNIPSKISNQPDSQISSVKDGKFATQVCHSSVLPSITKSDSKEGHVIPDITSYPSVSASVISSKCQRLSYPDMGGSRLSDSLVSNNPNLFGTNKNAPIQMVELAKTTQNNYSSTAFPTVNEAIVSESYSPGGETPTQDEHDTDKTNINDQNPSITPRTFGGQTGHLTDLFLLSNAASALNKSHCDQSGVRQSLPVTATLLSTNVGHNNVHNLIPSHSQASMNSQDSLPVMHNPNRTVLTPQMYRTISTRMPTYNGQTVNSNAGSTLVQPASNTTIAVMSTSNSVVGHYLPLPSTYSIPPPLHLLPQSDAVVPPRWNPDNDHSSMQWSNFNPNLLLNMAQRVPPPVAVQPTNPFWTIMNNTPTHCPQTGLNFRMTHNFGYKHQQIGKNQL